MANEVKFLQGQSSKLTQSLVSANTNTIFAAKDEAVFAIGGQLYYGQPTIKYENDKLTLYGFKDKEEAENVKLGEVDLTLESFVEGSKYIAGSAKTEGYSAEVAAYEFASGISSSITQTDVNNAYKDAFGESYSGDKSSIVIIMHNEHSSGDSHTVIVLPVGKLLGDVQTEIDNIEKSVGLNSDGTYSADTATTYVSGATSVKEAIHMLDSAISASTAQVSITSPNKTLDVVTSTSGTTADVNHDGTTIKQAQEEITFENGDTINANDLYAADAVIESGFTVLGGTVGNVSSGTKISGGTTVIELLKQILVKEADCKAVNPTCTLSISPTTSPVEVGTILTETLNSTYTDGKYTGSTADYGYAYSVDANCVQDTVTYKRGSTTLDSTTDTYTMPEGTTKWSCTSTYAASTVTPKKNNGTDSTVTIASGTTASSEKSITAKYKYYIGATTEAVASAMTVNKITAATLSKTGWIEVDSTTTIVNVSTKYTLPTEYFVIMCPSKYKLATIQDYTSGSDYVPKFTTSSVTVNIGGTSTETYTVYLWVKSESTPEVKNITLVKA